MRSHEVLGGIVWTALTIFLALVSFVVAMFCLFPPQERTVFKRPKRITKREKTAKVIVKAIKKRKRAKPKKRVPKRARRQKVSVLTFHDLSHRREAEALVTPRNEFTKMVLQLRTNGYQSFFASQVPYLTKGYDVGLKKGCKPVIYTFDDGYRNNYEILFPLLKRHKLKATIFLIVGKVVEERSASSGNALTWDEVREMAASGLVEFGSHTYSMHKNLVTYIRYGGNKKGRMKRWRELYRDLKVAKRVLENKVGLPVTTLAWPHGKRTRLHIKLAKKAGYKLVFNTQFGTNVPGHTNFGDIRRISASSRWMSAEALLKRLWLAERGRGLDGKPRQFVWATQ